MAIATNIWRFQCDPGDDPDPIVHVFLKKTVTSDGEDHVIQDMTPVPMRFSELSGIADLIDPVKINAKVASIKTQEASNAVAFAEAQANLAVGRKNLGAVK